MRVLFVKPALRDAGIPDRAKLACIDVLCMLSDQPLSLRSSVAVPFGDNSSIIKSKKQPTCVRLLMPQPPLLPPSDALQQIRYDQMAAPPPVSNKATSPPLHHNGRGSRSTLASVDATQPMDAKGAKGSNAATFGRDAEEEEDGGTGDGAGGGESEGFEGDEWEEGEVERGMLHALVELGHLEMLLHQVRDSTFTGNMKLSFIHAYSLLVWCSVRCTSMFFSIRIFTMLRFARESILFFFPWVARWLSYFSSYSVLPCRDFCAFSLSGTSLKGGTRLALWVCSAVRSTPKTIVYVFPLAVELM